jgi:hypothetical protein
MRSRWLVAVAILGGLLAAPAVAWFCLVVTIPFTYDTLVSPVPIAFAIFTLLTVPIGLLVAWKGTTPLQRGFSSGVLIGWAATGIWVGMGGVEVT